MERSKPNAKNSDAAEVVNDPASATGEAGHDRCEVALDVVADHDVAEPPSGATLLELIDNLVDVADHRQPRREQLLWTHPKRGRRGRCDCHRIIGDGGDK